MNAERKTILTGGRVTQGVVHIGDTVRRPISGHSPFVHRLLRHLEHAGFDACPRLLAETDGEEREVLSYIPGDVPTDLGWWTDDQLGEAATLIRRLHDATAGSEIAAGAEVVCHNDLMPCNFVFVDALPRAIIDFDAAAPGTRIWDLGYAAWGWLDAGNDEIAADEQARRLKMFANRYGWGDTEALVATMVERQRAQAARSEARDWKDAARWARQCADWTEGCLRPAIRRRSDWR
jgi:Ser/Thr protein kinase RdoA (MazF antagonist)